MSNLKEKLLGAWKAVKKEYTRVDRTCNNCRREIFGGETLGEKYFCPDCNARFPYNDGFICLHCGRSAIENVKLCDDCAGYEWSYDAARSPFYYAPPADKIIRDLKYDNRRFLAEVLAAFVAAELIGNFAEADVITFVPMTDGAKRKRRYNQSELIARHVSARTGIPAADVLEKVAETDRQAKLTRKERLNNLKGSIRSKNGALIEGKAVVLIDDVLTTGSTAEACSAALKKAGAEPDMTYVSAAGGAFLEWMEGKTLPGVAILEQ